MSPTIDILDARGARHPTSLPELLTALARARAALTPAFAAERLELVASVSAEILRRGVSRASPGVTHFAFWTRRGALKALAESHIGQLPAGCVARPRGLVFHLPPQNVETVFLYSWVISYLCGNANLVRLPTSLSADMAGLLQLFQSTMVSRGETGQIFVAYPAGEAANRALSAACDARVVWGGDAKVAAFAPLPLRAGGKSLWFGDRRSLAMVEAGALGALDDTERADLAERLHNDIFVFDQMACSSPVRLFVVGAEDVAASAVADLLEALAVVAKARGSVPATGHVIRKLVSSMAMAGEGAATAVTRHSNSLTSVVTPQVIDRPPVGGGFLEVVFVREASAIHDSLRENIQTIVHFGFAAERLDAFVRGLPPLCVTRLAPVGQALDFDYVWDGYDLIAELTQLLRIRR